MRKSKDRENITKELKQDDESTPLWVQELNEHVCKVAKENNETDTILIVDAKSFGTNVFVNSSDLFTMAIKLGVTYLNCCARLGVDATKLFKNVKECYESGRL